MIKRTCFLAIILIVVSTLMFSCLNPNASKAPMDSSPSESGNDTTFVFDGKYSEDFPVIKSDILYELEAGTIESEVFGKIGCTGKMIGSGRLIVGYELEEGGKARLFFDPLGSRDPEYFDRFQLTKVEILTDDWDLVKTVIG